MNQKQKIIIVLITSLMVIGSFSYLIFRSLETKDNQENVTIKSSPEEKKENNFENKKEDNREKISPKKQSIDNSSTKKKKNSQQLLKVEKKEESSLTFWKVIKYLAIIFLVVVVGKFVITFVIAHINNYMFRKRIQKFYQEGELTIDIEDNKIYIFFGPKKNKTYEIAEKLLQQDILNAQLPNAPENVKNIYDKLKQKKEDIIKIGRLMVDFFSLFSKLFFLTTLFLNELNKVHIVNAQMMNSLTKQVVKEAHISPEFDKRTYTIFFESYESWNRTNFPKALDLQEDKDPIPFFQETITDEEETYYQDGKEKVFLFNHYFLFYQIVRKISADLELLFADPKHAESQKYKQDYLNIINELNDLLGVKNPKNNHNN